MRNQSVIFPVGVAAIVTGNMISATLCNRVCGVTVARDETNPIHRVFTTSSHSVSERLLTAVLILSITYGVLYAFVVPVVASLGVLNPVSWLLLIQLLYPTFVAASVVADAVEAYL